MPTEEKTRRLPLTRYQRQLLNEMREIVSQFDLDYEHINQYNDAAERTARLRVMKDRIIRSQVIYYYTFVDEMLASAICHYFFGRKNGFIKLWKTKRFKLFNHYIIEVLSLTEKLRLVKELERIPKAIAKDIDTLNALRNGLAHAFFPQNLRSSKPVYKGLDIFTLAGCTRFDEDMQKLVNFFLNLNFGVRSKWLEDEQ